MYTQCGLALSLFPAQYGRYVHIFLAYLMWLQAHYSQPSGQDVLQLRVAFLKTASSTYWCKLNAVSFMKLNLSGNLFIILCHLFSVIPAFYCKFHGAITF
jgi:hypothetical protein